MRTLLTVLVVMVSTPALAHEAGVHARGTVRTVSPTKLDVDTAAGVKTFNLTPMTKFTRGHDGVTAADVHTGDRVVVHGAARNGHTEAVEVRLGDAPAMRDPK